jgi:hypothetical protein
MYFWAISSEHNLFVRSLTTARCKDPRLLRGHWHGVARRHVAAEATGQNVHDRRVCPTGAIYESPFEADFQVAYFCDRLVS